MTSYLPVTESPLPQEDLDCLRSFASVVHVPLAQLCDIYNLGRVQGRVEGADRALEAAKEAMGERK